jgi:hypothetical protein
MYALYTIQRVQNTSTDCGTLVQYIEQMVYLFVG